MPDGSEVLRRPTVDPAGRPIEGRKSQAITALSITLCWACLTVLIFWATRGSGPALPARFFAGVAIVAWLCAEAFGSQRGMVWPASALAIAGSLSLGFSVSLATSHLREPDIVPSIAIISGLAALSMLTYIFRFRLPGLVSPIITFSIISLFLATYGLDGNSLSKIEGLSPRGILAALISSSYWLLFFGSVAFGMVLLARWLDLNGDDFGVASARPLHLIGAGISALVFGRLLAALPLPWDLLGLGTLWIGAFVWGVRINRIAVTMAIHLAISRSMVLGVSDMLGETGFLIWRPDFADWTLILTLITLFNLAVWPFLHQISLSHGWTLGPGGRIPQPRSGWLWRYWPYA